MLACVHRGVLIYAGFHTGRQSPCPRGTRPDAGLSSLETHVTGTEASNACEGVELALTSAAGLHARVAGQLNAQVWASRRGAGLTGLRCAACLRVPFPQSGCCGLPSLGPWG